MLKRHHCSSNHEVDGGVVMGLLSQTGQANASEFLTEERKRGPRYRRWSLREECLVEARVLLGDTTQQIAERLGKEGYHRSYKSIQILIGKLGVSVATPFTTK